MAKTKITAPVAQPGEVIGVGGLVFTDGVAETDNEAILAYARDAGYGVGSTKPAKAESAKQRDSREIHKNGPDVVGTKLRDAAVEPKDEDFLPPTNAGKADPHGPEVVAPGIHALPPAPIVPGPVIDEDDPAQKGQQQRETDAAKAVLVDGQSPLDAVSTDEPAAGPLGLSDPSSVEKGVEDAKDVRAAERRAEKSGAPMPTAKPRKAARKQARKTTRKR